MPPPLVFVIWFSLSFFYFYFVSASVFSASDMTSSAVSLSFLSFISSPLLVLLSSLLVAVLFSPLLLPLLGLSLAVPRFDLFGRLVSSSVPLFFGRHGECRVRPKTKACRTTSALPSLICLFPSQSLVANVPPRAPLAFGFALLSR
jgi:hypothetical protein